MNCIRRVSCTSAAVLATLLGLLVGASAAQTLSTPVASPASGIYSESQSVQLTADTGAEIRYTLNGAEPTASSALYTSPLNVSAGTTNLRAKAFMSGWTASDTLIQSYVVDTTDPVISAEVTPAPNAEGWNNSAVTVIFSCSDALTTVTCPAPVVVSNEGTGQFIERTAFDAAGNEASASVTVNLDTTPGTATITSPSAPLTTTSATAVISGTVVDNLAGPTSATCNSEPAEIVDGVVECTVALHPGLNSVVLTLFDVAGNSASDGVAITRNGSIADLAVTPGSSVMVSGQRRLFVAASQYGPEASGISWTSSDEMVVEIDEDGTATALAPGTATLTATSASIWGEATVTVVASVALATGSAAWSLPPTPESTGTVIVAHRIDESGPDLFKVEYVAEGALVRALRADGTLVWTQLVQGTALFGDVFGGLILYTGNGVARIGGSPESTPWRYEGGGIYTPAHVAQGPSGVVFFTELSSDSYFNTLVGLDGATGRRLFRYDMPLTVVQSLSVHCPWPSSGRPWGPGAMGPLSIGEDGAVYFEVARTLGSDRYECDPMTGELIPSLSSVSYTNEALLVRVEPDGSGSSTPFRTWQVAGSLDEDWAADIDQPMLGAVAPDGAGGALATWKHYIRDVELAPWGEVLSVDVDVTEYVTRIFGGGTTDNVVQTSHWDGDPPEPVSFISPLQFVADDGVAYLKNSNGVTAVDTSSWTTLWEYEGSGNPLTALDGGGLVLHDEAAEALVQLDSSGNVVATVGSVRIQEPRSILGGQPALHGIDPSSGALVEVFVPEQNEAALQVHFRQSNITQAQQAEITKCTLPPYQQYPSWKAISPGGTFTYIFNDGLEGSGDDWRPEQKAGVEEAFTKWSMANATSGLNTNFVASTGPTGDIMLVKMQLAPNNPALTRPQPAELPSDGIIIGGRLEFTMDELLLREKNGYLKAALHEIGHLLGLANTPERSPRGSSVMNGWSQIVKSGEPPAARADDNGNNVPTEVRPCDRAKALGASVRPWP